MHVTTIGFDNEDDMVKGLAATNRNQSHTCFKHGAGETTAHICHFHVLTHAHL